MPARKEHLLLVRGAPHYREWRLTARDCALIAAALDIVNPDDSEDRWAKDRARELAELFRQGV